MTNHSKNSLHLDHFLPYRLSRLSNEVSEGIADTYRNRFSLSVTSWRVMALLGHYPDSSATELAELGALDKVAVSRAVSNLVKLGFVEKVMTDEDRRRASIALTEKGQEAYDEIAPAALAYEAALLEILSTEEQTLLDTLIDRLTVRAKQLAI